MAIEPHPALAFFGRPLELDELTAAWDEVPEWMSSDGCRLYFSSNRPGGAGGWDLWLASRAP